MPIILQKKYTNGTHLAVWQITESHDELQAMLPSEILTDAELANIHHPQKQVEFFCSRLTIKFLTDFLDIKYLGIKKDEFGKPYLVGTHWQMSLTHTTHYVAVVMHPTQALGIDMEKPSEKLRKIAHRIMSKNEVKDANDDLEKLCIYWSAKEALYKLYGKKKVDFRGNLFISPFQKEDYVISGKLNINEIDEEYSIFIENIAEYLLAVACQ
jgi:4'-phosphopantetheinyl transferase